MELIFAYGAGLLTLINPCVVPVLPIVLATALQASPRGPIALAAGMSLSFVVMGVTVTAFGHLIGLDVDTLSRIGAGMMVLFGAALLIPQGARLLSRATEGLSFRADARMNGLSRDLGGQFAGGLLLGLVWSPCIGPTLGGAIALASQGEGLLRVTAIMAAFALGVSTLILGLAYGTRGALGRYNAKLRAASGPLRKLLGAAFLLVGLGILFQWHHIIEGWLIEHLPAWLIDLSVKL
ncbi:cytochrome c biogenesis CcdA family protein [Pseudoprimorskyibacter insulae]|uniref:Cytochrome C biogenesis protein transmembrane domain-containing protein n=1 Tax=Pseudoprimorskyibacter insulae TaxID=1695997 RepID=A0A2R8AUZ4_9RHOB|nr:cytochrome c biogenesis CcdA family protein [Pseudoprimorskyibacter insulae]SPF79820.1 hypothetical protein PRI8871_01619 [Pseudoprimorskyibacter insulae]